MKQQQLFIAFLLLLQLSLQVVGQKTPIRPKSVNAYTPDRCGVDAVRLQRIKEDPNYEAKEREREAETQRRIAAAEEQEIREAQARGVAAYNKRVRLIHKDPAVVNPITSAFIQPQIDVLRNLTNYNMEHLPVKIIDSSSKPKSKTKKHKK